MKIPKQDKKILKLALENPEGYCGYFPNVNFYNFTESEKDLAVAAINSFNEKPSEKGYEQVLFWEAVSHQRENKGPLH
jgi:hypothetical protein